MMDAELKRWIREHLHEIKGQELRAGETLAERFLQIEQSAAEQRKWRRIRTVMGSLAGDIPLHATRGGVFNKLPFPASVSNLGTLAEVVYWKLLLTDAGDDLYLLMSLNVVPPSMAAWNEEDLLLRKKGLEDFCELGENGKNLLPRSREWKEEAETYWNPQAVPFLVDFRRNVREALSELFEEVERVFREERVREKCSPWVCHVEGGVIRERIEEAQGYIGFLIGTLPGPDSTKTDLLKAVLELGKKVDANHAEAMQGIGATVAEAKAAKHAAAGAHAEAARGRLTAEGARSAAEAGTAAAQDAERASLRAEAAAKGKAEVGALARDYVETFNAFDAALNDEAGTQLEIAAGVIAEAKEEGRLIGNGNNALFLRYWRGWVKRGRPDAEQYRVIYEREGRWPE